MKEEARAYRDETYIHKSRLIVTHKCYRKAGLRVREDETSEVLLQQLWLEKHKIIYTVSGDNLNSFRLKLQGTLTGLSHLNIT